METKAEKIRVGKTRERERGEEMRKEKTKKEENNRSKESSRRMRNIG